VSGLDVAINMDEMEIVEEEPWGDNDSDADADIEGRASEEEQE